MKILITGAAGFLGTELVRQLAGRHEIFCLTRRIDRAAAAQTSVSWIETDLSNGLDRSALPARLDAIIHLAQSKSYTNFPDGAPDVFAVNIRLVQELCEYGLAAGVTRMVLASTGTVYEPFNSAMRETDALRPAGYYGASKLAAELISEAYSKYFTVSNLRVFFLYGAGQKNMMIARLIDNVRLGGKVTLPSDGKGLLFVPTHVSDTAKAFVQAVEEAWTGPVNVASPHAIHLGDLIRLIAKETGKELNLELTSQPSPAPIVPNLDLLRSIMPVDGFLTPELGLRRTIQGQ
jgi:UDP-glucose 4-epimerase